jgi:radical SAM superfamily enzyme YgiQ (UPF0313 family)
MKLPHVVKNEIEFNIEKYGVKQFAFLDNDIIGCSTDNYKKLLSIFQDIRNKYDSFIIKNAEIITKGTNSETVRQMSLAGISSVQIGYESTCDSLLQKINKKNSFSSNSLFVKWAIRYGVNIDGVNILIGLIGETSEDIQESTNNLHYLRFYIGRNGFKHRMSNLHVMSSSPYYKYLYDTGEIKKYNNSILFDFLPTNFIPDKYRMDVFSFGHDQTNFLWNHFEEVEKHYHKSSYSYQLRDFGSFYKYYEYLNGALINELDFEENGIYWKILNLCNNEIKSINGIIDELNHSITCVHNKVTYDTISTILKELNSEFILYSNYDYSENFSILDVNSVY